ncbi:hypothetical protein [Pasteurella atlantica]|uniref:DoxX family protein n=1 Tax=Pasteurellaceae TaxID=712 RepID=UPI002753E1F7|nr:hypothetical protein [Pasteurella atlantica]MDP8098246.1 hypothetical protein [Pasteurella atlantica]MDP8106523.1 hypothetical protein [Pasteurella atlantica]MDP8116049.1 hypothetical protein [Pasteurella atlantica]
MQKLKQYALIFLHYLLVIFMINAGIQHFLKVDFYMPFVPRFLPFTEFFVYFSAVIEIILGVLLAIRFNHIRPYGKTIATWSALAIFMMFWVFLPIHISDVFMENPAIGTHKLALIRVPIQFVFIGWAWVVYRFLSNR